MPVREFINQCAKDDVDFSPPPEKLRKHIIALMESYANHKLNAAIEEMEKRKKALGKHRTRWVHCMGIQYAIDIIKRELT